jgi:mRNA interferase MazF
VNPKPGEISVVDLGVAAKVRPANVVSREDPNSPRAIAVLVPLTTQFRGSAYEVSLGKLGFLHKESWVNVQGITALGHERIGRRLGRVTQLQLEKIRAALAYLLELSLGQ